ncbi:MAG: type II secretion system F family protein, partial [Planctomycetaceae bacterium]
LLITTQLSIMMRSGMDLADAVRQLSRQSKNVKAKSVLERIHGDLQDGRSFSAALNSQAETFGDAFVASVAAGESSGQLVDVLARLKNLLRNEVRLQSAIRGALMYPAILLFVALVVVGALVFFVLPQFDKVFKSLSVPAPPTTQILLDLGHGVRSHIWVVLLVAAGAVFGAVRCWSTKTARRFRDRAMLQTRWVRNGTQALLSGRVFRLVGTMLQSGVPLLEAIRLSRRSVNNALFHELFDDMESEILSGSGIAPVLSRARCVPAGAAELIATAERTGQLGTVMEMVGEFYEEEGERRIRDQVKLLEPAIIVVMGVLVAFVVSSVMLPLFDLSSSKSHKPPQNGVQIHESP